MNNKIISSLILLTLSIFIFSACKKEKNTPPTPITVKYEIISTSPIKDTTVIGSIKYTEANGADQTVSDFLPGYTTWTKTITLTSTTRPLTLKLSTPTNYFVESQASVTGKIYVNDIEYVRSTNNLVSGNNTFIIFLPEISAVVN
jgi:hypothetical protein